MSQEIEDKPISQFTDQDLLNLSVRELNRHLRGLPPDVSIRVLTFVLMHLHFSDLQDSASDPNSRTVFVGLLVYYKMLLLNWLHIC